MDRTTVEPGRFDEAVDWFASRVILSSDERKQVPTNARSRAFWIAGAAQLDVVQTVRDALTKAIADGGTVEDFRAKVRTLLMSQWGGDNPRRIDLIFRNATQQAYNAGRYAQMEDPTVKRFRPYRMFDAILDGRTSDICTECNGTILPADDPWWDTHSPQLHHACRSSIRALRRAEAERRGITQSPTAVAADTGFGVSPRLAQEWRPEPEGRDQRLMAELERKRAALSTLPAVPDLPETFAREKPAPKRPEKRDRILLRPGKSVQLTAAQSDADQTARFLNASFAARQKASFEERRTWLLWEWSRGTNRAASNLLKQAALREFKLSGVPWTNGRAHSFQPADVVRTQRDLYRLHSETQAWFRRRQIRYVTLYRGVHGTAEEEARSAVEAWTSDKAAAEQFARSGPNGRVLKVTVPVAQVLTHHRVSGWVDGPWGSHAEYLVLW